MNRRFRLRQSADFERVRRSGKSFAHPLIVLIVHENQLQEVRIGVTASRSLGKAVQRNRAKRLIRAAIQPLMDGIRSGHDLVWIARLPILDTSFHEIQQTMLLLMQRANILNPYER